MTPRHHLDPATVLSHAAGALSQELAAVVATHLEGCTTCREAVRQAEGVGGLLINQQHAQPALETRAQAESLFDSEFMNRAEALSQRMLFVRDAAGTPVASAALWFGSPFGAEIDRIHWVATDEAHQRRGLCGAMLCELLKRHEALGAPGGVYLISQTFSYPAIRIYQRFGFRRLLTRRPAEYHLDAPFAETAARAWAIIDEKLR